MSTPLLPRRPRARGRKRTRATAFGVARGLELEMTGGTRDVKPQYLNITAPQSGTDATTTTTVALPILRNFSSGPARAQLIEILKVFVFLDNTVEVDSSLTVKFSTKSGGTTVLSPADPTVFAAFSSQVKLTTSGLVEVDKWKEWDCTDGAGNGILVATDNIYVQVSSVTTGATNTIYGKVLYRMYGASVTEYVGIVQGQS